MDDSITFKCNIAINAGGDDLHLTGMTSVVETHNQSYLCAVFNFDDATSAQGDPLLNADYTLQSDSPCVGNGDKWWTTGPRPSGYLGDPSPDTDVDMGADQSLFSSSHPANL